jgi:hypothetical protein
VGGGDGLQIWRVAANILNTILAICCHLLTLVSSLADFSILKMEAIRSSEISVHTNSTGRHIPEDLIIQTFI